MTLTSQYFADFHIHVGRSKDQPVKMAAARNLTVEAVFREARERKGLDIITLIDGVCTNVLSELKELVGQDRLRAVPCGGYQFENGLMVLIGSEVEVGGPVGGAAHFGCWFPTLDAATDFHDWLATVQTNPSLSSQRARADAYKLQTETTSRGGLFIIHHAFTPHKGMYGNCVSHLTDMVDGAKVDALELGLSADSDMADCIHELKDITFISNSDAHSAAKIAREYNALQLQAATFDEVKFALRRQGERFITANFGLHPALGKYHRSRCAKCGETWNEETGRCSCGSTKQVIGVYDRLLQIRDSDAPFHPQHRPPYRYQVPLEFVPGLGPKSLARLLDEFGSEMAVLNRVSFDELANVVGKQLADVIDKSRSGEVQFIEGGGGVYGKLIL
ncbi:TIGR00375 family protein [Alicyclobacillus curvatus]|nr:TIGR00375 family protein [Alicyclobacillus curvatus]